MVNLRIVRCTHFDDEPGVQGLSREGTEKKNSKIFKMISHMTSLMCVLGTVAACAVSSHVSKSFTSGVEAQKKTHETYT